MTITKYLNDGHVALLFGVTAFIYFSYTGLTRKKISSENDLMALQGHFSRYSFEDNTGLKNLGHKYYIWIDGYKNRFQIRADYLGIFKSGAFVLNVRPGENIEITIPKSEAIRLNTDQNVRLTSVKVKRTIYLSKKEVLRIEKDIGTSNADFILGAAFLVAGVAVYLGQRRSKSKADTHARNPV